MKVCQSVNDLKNNLKELNSKPVGFVPTMGALHRGHISLIEYSMKECPVSVVSIFVNPTQFNDRLDFERYPRMPEKDINLLSTVLREHDMVFLPTEKEIYPENVQMLAWDFGNLDKVLEGFYRPGHFRGVAQVVNRLFEIVNPDIAYFGQKDFQQLVIIKELVRQTGRKIKIVGCPVIREPDGLAMSSRNLLLKPSLRQKAGIIFHTLKKASEMINSSEISEIKKFVKSTIESEEGFKLEYFEIVDDDELRPLENIKSVTPGKKYYGCIAVWAGNIRLIDNIEFNCSVSKG